MNKSTLQKMAKQYAPQDKIIYVQVGDKNVEIKVKPVLSLAELGTAANEICELQFATDENGNESYIPWLRLFAERYVVVNHFTDIDLTALKKDDVNTYSAVEPIWQFLWSDIYEQILDAVIADDSCIGDSTYWALRRAADDMVNARRKALEPGAAKLWASLDELVDQVKGSMGEMTQEDLEQTREAIAKLTQLDEEKIVELMR